MKREPIYQGRILNLARHDVTLPSGVTTSLDIFEHPGAAAIVPYDGERVILIRQYRYAAGGYLWEIPAGTLEKGEEPIACARRELVEEAGVRSDHIRPLGKIFTVPSFCTEIIWLFLAEQLEPADVARDVDEVIDEVRAVPFDEALMMIARGEICDGKSISGLHLAAQTLGFVR
jgi:ADP-ribose pyrophosphatase